MAYLLKNFKERQKYKDRLEDVESIASLNELKQLKRKASLAYGRASVEATKRSGPKRNTLRINDRLSHIESINKNLSGNGLLLKQKSLSLLGNYFRRASVIDPKIIENIPQQMKREDYAKDGRKNKSVYRFNQLIRDSIKTTNTFDGNKKSFLNLNLNPMLQNKNAVSKTTNITPKKYQHNFESR